MAPGQAPTTDHATPTIAGQAPTTAPTAPGQAPTTATIDGQAPTTALQLVFIIRIRQDKK